MPEDRLDNLLNEIRSEEIPAAEIAAAQARVWDKIAAAPMAACAEFRADIAVYAAGRLEGSRRLLLEDHLSRCAACRRSLADSQGTPRPQPVKVMRRRALPAWSRWAIAAGLAAVAVFLGRGPLDRALAGSGPRATVASVQGSLYHLRDGLVTPGAALGEDEVVRTGMGSRAVLRLRDGSLVEVNERTELSVESAWSGQTVKLERGDIIVQAAKQRRGRLQVVTRDSTASVKGTIFAVSSGLAGSVVSVVEGSVEVQQPTGTRLLRRGQRAGSSAATEAVPVRRTVAWSAEASRYLALLGELGTIENAIAASGLPTPRTEARLLPYLPSGAVLYLAMPNPGAMAQQATALIEQRAVDSQVLRDWWGSASGQHFKLLFEKTQTFAPMIGEEIVLVLAKPASGSEPLPAVMAEVRPGQAASLKQALGQLITGGTPAVSVSDTLLVAAGSQAQLDQILARLGQGAATPFAAEIASHYRGGVRLLFISDVGTAMGSAATANKAAAVLGVDKLKYASIEQRLNGSADEAVGTLVFSGPRTGIASWLATPGVAGSAEYVSATAIAAVSASTRNPRQAFDELVTLIGQVNPAFPQALAQVQMQAGVEVAADIASALGTDFTFAVEQPTIPIPGWFAAVEVNQPALLDSAIRRLAATANNAAAAAGQPPLLSIETENADGRTWTVLRNSRINLALQWSYDRGYWVLSTDRALAAAAIATRSGGSPLVRSALFQAQIPASAGLHQSAFFWLNTQGPISSIAAVFGGSTLKELLESREPMLVVVNGETERIQAASRTRLMSMLVTMMLAGGPGQAGRHGDNATNSGN